MRVTGGVITSAGLVLAATFSVLAVMPTVAALQQGLLIAVGVLLDTLIVRSLLVPALALLPKGIWRLPAHAADVLRCGIDKPQPRHRELNITLG
ncbi:MMPL family transporter [Actinomadura rubrisoli]|uniref:MMPL family transporter n=1 Tax=Actinomadura rubrisoli TaxID=2530368 RepID=UPI003C7A286D